MARVCVTGATGYIGSWLVHTLIDRGYVVHATARDTVKASQIFSSLSYGDRLKFFKADLLEDGSFDEAVKDCVGVFHVAAFMEFDTSVSENIQDYVKARIIDPAVKATINVLSSCLKSKTVKRVIFTSSISTITAKHDDGKWRMIADESSLVSIDRVLKEKPKGWVYILIKRMTEEAAIEFANEKGIDLISIVPPTVAGPFLTPNIPTSNQVILSPITGDTKLYPILVAVQTRLGSVPLVHIQDICNAHIFLMENSSAKGRYICVAGSSTIPQLKLICRKEVSSLADKTSDTVEGFINSSCSEISSDKIRNLGFEFKYSVDDVIKETLSSCANIGFLDF